MDQINQDETISNTDDKTEKVDIENILLFIGTLFMMIVFVLFINITAILYIKTVDFFLNILSISGLLVAVGGFFFLIYGYIHRESFQGWSIVALGVFSIGMSILFGLGWIMNKNLPNMPDQYGSIMKELKEFDFTVEKLIDQIFQFEKIDVDRFFQVITESLDEPLDFKEANPWNIFPPHIRYFCGKGIANFLLFISIILVFFSQIKVMVKIYADRIIEFPGISMVLTLIMSVVAIVSLFI